MRESRNPVVYAGGGIGMGNALAEFRAFIETTRIPVVATLKGLGRAAHHARTGAGNDGHARHENREPRGADLRFTDLRGRAISMTGRPAG